MKLSLCIATFNEEKNIHIPLDSAIDFVDEVIIVDGSSKDRTVEIAKSYGAKVKVFVVDNPRNFLQNKQRAIEKASGEWILQLDADEALSDELKEEIKQLIHRNFQFPISNFQTNSKSQIPNPNFVAFNIPRKNWFLTQFLMKGGVYPDYVLRLYKKSGAKFDLKDIHENVKIIDPQGSKIKDLRSRIGYLNNPILHYADPTFSRYLLRWDRYTIFDAETAVHEGKKLGFFSYFFIKPTVWFLKTYFRHKGFMDGFPGFVFCLFSSLRFWVIYIKWWGIINSKRKT